MASLPKKKPAPPSKAKLPKEKRPEGKLKGKNRVQALSDKGRGKAYKGAF